MLITGSFQNVREKKIEDNEKAKEHFDEGIVSIGTNQL